MLDGAVTLRTPDGERELEPGDVAVFRRGPEGAHALAQPTPTSVCRVAVFSSMRPPRRRRVSRRPGWSARSPATLPPPGAMRRSRRSSAASGTVDYAEVTGDRQACSRARSSWISSSGSAHSTTWSVVWWMSKRSSSMRSIRRRARRRDRAPRSTTTCARQRREAGRDRPHVQVVHLDDLWLGRHRLPDVAHVGAGRGGLQQHVDGLLQQPPRARRDQRGDQEAGDRVRRVPARDQHQRAGHDHAERAERVAGGVPQHALEVEVLPLPRGEHPRRRQRCRPGRRDRAPASPAPADVGRIAEPGERLDHDQHGHDQQQHAVRERTEHLAALQAVGARRRRRHAREPRGHQPDRDRADVGRRCPASASSASEPASIPPTTVATSSTTLIASADAMRRRLPARRASSRA